MFTKDYHINASIITSRIYGRTNQLILKEASLNCTILSDFGKLTKNSKSTTLEVELFQQ